MMHVVRKFAGTVLPGIVKPLRVLWNEVIGFMFLVLGVIFGFSAWRKYKEFNGDFASLLLLIMAGFFVVLMIGSWQRRLRHWLGNFPLQASIVG